jgi:hypothetical protein
MDTRSTHEIETFTFTYFKRKRRMELGSSLPENVFEDKVTEEWKTLSPEEKTNYYHLAEENQIRGQI